MRTYAYFTVLLFAIFQGALLADNQNDIVQKGIKLYDENKYDEAIKEFQSVDENDSSFIFAQAELALAYIAKNEYDSAIHICKKALRFPSSHTQHLLGSLATSYDEIGDREMAINTYKKAIEIAPFNYLNHFNLGYTYTRVNNYSKAMDCYQEALRCNPFHASSHLHLGLLAARQNHLTRAVLSLETFLLLEPNSNRSNRHLIFLESIAQSYVDTSYGHMIDPVIDNELFADLDHLIASRFIVTNDFEPCIDFNVAIVKQTEMLFQKLPLDTIVKDFWVEMYFPFYKAVKNQGHMNSLLHTMMRSVGNEELKKWEKKNEKRLKEFYSLGSELAKIKYYRDIIENTQEIRISVHYDDGNIESVGNLDNEEKKTGRWKYYHTNGSLSAVGNYLNDLKQGKWHYYSDDGKLNYEEMLVDGESEGISKKYHPTGRLSYSLNYKNNEPHGVIDLHFLTGELSEIQVYKEGVQNGPGVSFYATGDTSTIFELKEGEFDGVYKSFYNNGQLSNITNYKNGLKIGESRDYHKNGELKSVGSYNEGKHEGEWKFYHDNGVLGQFQIFRDSLLVGVEKRYYRNGNLESESNYNEEGKLHGTSKYYNYKGIHYRSEIFNNGRSFKLISYDAEGNVIKESEAEDEINFSFSANNLKGRKHMTGFDKNGKRDSTWTYYWQNGKVKEILNYKNGLLNGEYKNYFVNGQLKYESTYVEGKQVGPYRSFYVDGAKSVEGVLEDGHLINYWKYYTSSGDLWLKAFYLDGDQHGWQSYYSNNGSLYKRERYHLDKNVETIIFDQNQDTLCEIDLLEDSVFRILSTDDVVQMHVNLANYLYQDTLVYYYPNQKIQAKKIYLNGKKDGEQLQFYPNGKLWMKNNYLQGDMHGWDVTWHENGLVLDSTFYVYGEKEGVSLLFYDNGMLRRKRNFHDGMLDGVCDYFGPRGEKQIRLHFIEDELIAYQTPENNTLGWGEQQEIVTGNEAINAFYVNGKPSFKGQLKEFLWHGEKIFYNEEGQLLTVGNYAYGEDHGTYKKYYLNGALKIESTYSMGYRNGLLKEYYANGVLKRECNYYRGDKHGLEKWYDANGDLQNTYEYFQDLFLNKAKAD